MHDNCPPLELTRLVNHVRAHSPYYAELWRKVPQAGWTLADLPLVDLRHYWAAGLDLDSWPVLTGPMSGAVVYKTGGTTGSAKHSVFTQAEWEQFVATFGRSLSSLLAPGDRVANLFFAGDLYASFLFIQGALARAQVPICVFPFTGAVEPQVLTEQIELHQINVLAGVPGKLLQYASLLEQQGVRLPGVRMVLYGGESLFVEQLQLFRAVLPNARVVSIGCASVDAGLIGASTPDCLPGEHRAFEPETLVEIVDEASGLPIHEAHCAGLLVVTNLTRTLMPIIRYPVGDLAEWTEAPGRAGRKFRLMGRSSQGNRVRVGYATLFPDDLAQVILARLGPRQWQLTIDQVNGVDHIVLRIAHDKDPAAASALLQAIGRKDPAVVELMAEGALRIAIEWCRPAQLATHRRTGKLQRVVDRRDYCGPAGRLPR
ncbi:phenylacetate--CoA ligase family protein [Pseudomonas xantholysinigenes]|uniref:AMP-binding protein n=1 Tax=Pseudomonas xantholysinigenes TaxID=2745490 RepID=A0A9E6TYI4_9PSED|nr:AMP-binding protein [Pseudomonas xantholysinigenes]QXI39055.1 AMP-binding protein [Pseudomonas xantholysinigenes]